MTKSIVGGVVGVCLAGGVLTDAQFSTSYEAQVLRVIDGDTIEVQIELFPGLIRKVKMRERDLDTAESRYVGKGSAQCEREKEIGLQTKELVKSHLPPGTVIGVRNVSGGKYFGRAVGDMLLKVDGKVVDLGDWLIGQGLAVHYDGGTKRKAWCTEDQTRAPGATGDG